MTNQLIGKNVEMEVKGDKMIITIDLTKDFGPSSSGKTTVVATTAGARPVETEKGTVLVGVNINKK